MSSSSTPTTRKSTWAVYPSQSQFQSPLGIDTITFIPLDEYSAATACNKVTSVVPQPHPVTAAATASPGKQPIQNQSPPQTPPQQPAPEPQPRQQQHPSQTTPACLVSHEAALPVIVALEADSSSPASGKQGLPGSGIRDTSSSGTQAPCSTIATTAASSTSTLSQDNPQISTASSTGSTSSGTTSGPTSPKVAIHETQSTTPADQELVTPLPVRSRLSIPSSLLSNFSLPKVSRSTSSAATSLASFASRPRSQSSATTASTSLKGDHDSRRNSAVSVLSFNLGSNSSSNANSNTSLPCVSFPSSPSTTTTSSSQGANSSPILNSGSGSSAHHQNHSRSHSPPPQRAPRILFQSAASSSTVTPTASSSPVGSTVLFSAPPNPASSVAHHQQQQQQPLSPTSTIDSPPSSPPPSKDFLARMIKLTRNKSVPASASSISPSNSTVLPMRKTSTNVFSSFPTLTLTRTTSDSRSIFSSNTTSTSTSPKTSIKLSKTHSRSSSKTRSRSGSTVAQPDPALINRIISAIQRGSFITLSDMDLDALIVALQGKNSKVLEALNISAASISASDAKVLARLIRSSEAANIKSLKMTGSTISQQASKLLFEAWKFNRTITTLRLSRSGVDDKTVKYLSRMLAKNETLATLDLSNNSITAVGMEMLAEAMLVNRSITRLSLQSNNLRRAGAPHVAKILSRNRVLKHLNIGSNSLGPDGSVVIAEAVRFNRTLISLALDMNELGVKGAQALGTALGSNRHLTHLYIPHNNIGDNGVVHLCEALKRNRTLNVLDLELNNIGQARNVMGLMRLGEVLRVNGSLRELNLAYNLVSSEAVQELTVGLIENSSLESIVLTNCCLTEDSAKSLAKVLTSPKTGLQNLGLSSNPDIGVDGYWALATALVKNRSLKGIQLDYNSDDRQQLYESIQNSLTRNHIWQQAIYSAACRILSLSRIVLLGRPGISREQYFGVDPNQQALQRSMSIASATKQGSSSWGGKILRRMVGRTNSSNSLASMLSIGRRDSHGPHHHVHYTEGSSNQQSAAADAQHHSHHHPHGSTGGGHTRKDSVASASTFILGNGTVRSIHSTVSGAPMVSSAAAASCSQQQQHLASQTPSPSASEQQQQQQQQQPPPTPTSAASFQLPGPDYHYQRILPNLGDMPCEIFENICAFLDPGRCMTIAQVRATVREADDRSTLRSSMTKDKMLERIFKGRYISPMGTRYNARPDDA